jgi:hypothetical protein
VTHLADACEAVLERWPLEYKSRVEKRGALYRSAWWRDRQFSNQQHRTPCQAPLIRCMHACVAAQFCRLSDAVVIIHHPPDRVGCPRRTQRSRRCGHGSDSNPWKKEGSLCVGDLPIALFPVKRGAREPRGARLPSASRSHVGALAVYADALHGVVELPLWGRRRLRKPSRGRCASAAPSVPAELVRFGCSVKRCIGARFGWDVRERT